MSEANKLPEFLYVLHGLDNRSMIGIIVYKYTIINETNKYWKVACRSGNLSFLKDDYLIHTSMESVKTRLQDIKLRRLAEARRSVKVLKNKIKATIHTIPPTPTEKGLTYEY